VLKTNADGTATLARGALGALGTVFGVNGSGALTGVSLVAPALGAATATTLSAATTIGVGNATPSASGSGITFPATQSPSSDANTLDDYEEGTFTPTVAGAALGGTGTYAAQGGFYTKIGNLVSFNLYINWTNLVGATGALCVAGLPFPAAVTANNYSAVSFWSDLLALTASNYLTCYIPPNATTVTLQSCPVGGGGVNNVAIDTSASIMLSGTYRI
jgi:hypothetical protein